MNKQELINHIVERITEADTIAAQAASVQNMYSATLYQGQSLALRLVLDEVHKLDENTQITSYDDIVVIE